MTPDKKSSYQPRYWGTLDEYIRQVRPRARRINLAAAAALPQRLPRRRPRDPEEESILTRLAIFSWNRAIESGLLEQIEPRRYKLNG
ncbi:MAG: hypothetical protein ACOYEO_07115 [bacterium]|jgi:hypothetical protein